MTSFLTWLVLNSAAWGMYLFQVLMCYAVNTFVIHALYLRFI